MYVGRGFFAEEIEERIKNKEQRIKNVSTEENPIANVEPLYITKKTVNIYQ